MKKYITTPQKLYASDTLISFKKKIKTFPTWIIDNQFIKKI